MKVSKICPIPKEKGEPDHAASPLVQEHQGAQSSEAIERFWSEATKRLEGKGEPDHVASPLVQEHQSAQSSEAIERFWSEATRK